jgi:hypothetical protein
VNISTACSADTIGKVLRIVLAIAAVCFPLKADAIDDAYQRLYNFDFADSHRILDEHIRANPLDPLGYTTRAATYLFFELDRLKILAGEFFADDKKISGDDKLEPDPRIREKFFGAIDEAQRIAEGRLAGNPGDPVALFSFCLTEGMRTDYMAFIEKKQFRSLGAAKKSHKYALELLRRDPTFVDAYLTTGLTEYLVGSLPFFIRWFVRFDQVQGSKQQAIVQLEKVSRDGRYLGPFARILLSLLYLREKKPEMTIRLLEDLTKEFPENTLLRYELAKIKEKFPGPKLRR